MVVTTYLTNSNFREGGFIWAHSLEEHSPPWPRHGDESSLGHGTDLEGNHGESSVQLAFSSVPFDPILVPSLGHAQGGSCLFRENFLETSTDVFPW